MSELICAVCLYEIARHLPGAPLLPQEAITIANGQAMCTEHFIARNDLVNPDHGPVALGSLSNVEVQKASISRKR